MKKLLATVLLLLPLTVTWGTGGFTLFRWTANPPDQQVTHYTMSCGNQPGTYTVTKDILAPAMTLPIVDIIATDGTWFCSLTATNSSGTSPPSPEVSFFMIAGTVYDLKLPAAPATFSIE